MTLDFVFETFCEVGEAWIIIGFYVMYTLDRRIKKWKSKKQIR